MSNKLHRYEIKEITRWLNATVDPAITEATVNDSINADDNIKSHWTVAKIIDYIVRTTYNDAS